MQYWKHFLLDLKPTFALKQVLTFSLLIGLYTFIPLFTLTTYLLNPVLGGLETILGIVIGLLLVFRANRAYERWWEARSLWGQLTNASRNYAIKTRTMIKLGPLELNTIHKLICSFLDHFKYYLEDVGKNDLQLTINKTTAIYQLNNDMKEEGLITVEQFWMLDRELRVFMEVLGGCQKIKNTLVAKSFRIFTRHTMIIFLLFLPWSLVKSFTYWAIVISFISAYIVLGLEGIAYNLEEPFGTSEDHLDIDVLVEGIKHSTGEILLDK